MNDQTNKGYNKYLSDYLEMVIERDRAISEVDRLQIKAEMYLGLCKERRAIAIDMAAHVAFEYHYETPHDVMDRILKLMTITQDEHDGLVERYKLKDRHGK